MKFIDVKTGNEISRSFFASDFFNLEIIFLEKAGDGKIYLSFSNATRLLNLYHHLLKNKAQFPCKGRIVVNLNNVTSIDFGFVSFVYLVRHQFSEIQITIDFSLTGKRKTALYYTLKQVFSVSYLFLPSDYFSADDILLSVKTSKVEEIIRKGFIAKYLKNISNHYCPAIFLNSSTLKEYFLSSSRYNQFEQWIDWDFFKVKFLSYKKAKVLSTRVYLAAIDSIIHRLTNLNEEITHIHVLNVYYLKLLADLDIIQSQKAFKENSAARGIKFYRREIEAKENDRYSKRVMNSLDASFYHPIFMLLFSVQIQHIIPRGTRAHNDDITAIVTNMLEFTKNLFYGIREIATNAIEHSSFHRGVLTGRVFNKDTLKHIKAEGLLQIEQFFEELNQIFEASNRIRGLSKRQVTANFNRLRFLDLNVLDDGEEGIMNKVLSSLKDQLLHQDEKNKDILQWYTDDMKNIENNEISLKDLLDFKEVKLRRQAHRSIAHLGLLIFSHLISKNRGYVFASSPDDLGLARNSSPADTVERHIDYSIHIVEGLSGGRKRYNEKRGTLISSGMFYNVILPLDISRYPGYGYPPHISALETQSDITHFDELFDVACLNNADILDVDPDKLKMAKICLLQLGITSYEKQPGNKYYVEEKSLDEILNQLNRLRLHGKPLILALNLEHLSITEDISSLYRLLARIHIACRAINSFIIYNIEDKIAKTLSEIARILASNHATGESCFWNEDKYTLMYSYEVTQEVAGEVDSSTRLYYAEILGGKTLNEYHWINNKISHTHFANLSIPKIEEPPLERSKQICNNILFRGDKLRLQNFELLIEHDNKTLFEHSVSALLMKEIIPD